MVKTYDYKTILVGVDGSENSHVAFTEAVNIAIRNGAEVNVAQIINDTRSILTSDSVKELRASAEEEFTLLKNIAKNLGYAGELNSHILVGSPKQLIANKLPEMLSVDLIIVGKVGKHVIKGSILGSVTSYAVKHAPCNVLVCK